MYSDDFTTDEMVIVCMAREIKDYDVMAQGIATPLVTNAYLLAKKTHAPHCTPMFHMGNTYVLETRPVSLLYFEKYVSTWALRFQHSGEVTMEHLPSGRVTVEYFRLAQIDMYGNFNNTCIGDWYSPKVRLPGAAGIPEVSITYKKILLYVPRHDKRCFTPKIDFVSGVGFLDGKTTREQMGFPGKGPYHIITDLAVLGFDEKTRRMKVISLHPGVTRKEIQEKTGFELIIPEDTPTTEPPTKEQIRIIREEIDPLNIRRLEFLPAEERDALLDEIIESEMPK